MISFSVSPRLIEDALHIPENHVIEGAEWNFALDVVRLYVSGPDLPEVPELGRVPDVTPAVTTNYDPRTMSRTYKWDWNLPKK